MFFPGIFTVLAIHTTISKNKKELIFETTFEISTCASAETVIVSLGLIR